MSEALSLGVVPPEEYQEFADALQEYLPHSYQMEAMLRGQLRYSHLELFKAQLYAPADASLRHQLALIAPAGSRKEIFVFKIFWNEGGLSDDEVCQLLRSLPAVDWKKPILVRQMPSHLRANMDAILSKLSEGELQLFTTMKMGMLTLSPGDFPPIPELPTGYYFGDLNSSFGEEILMRWIGAYIDTPESMSDLLDTLPSAAVFHKNDSKSADDASGSDRVEKDELVSYSLYKFISDIGMTYTKENHRRQGLARAVTLRLAHKVHEDGLPVQVAINDTITVSRSMHLEMGFKPYTRVEMPFYFPKNFDFKNNLHRLPNFERSFPDSIKQWEKTRKKL